jgi:hypothetical protein
LLVVLRCTFAQRNNYRLLQNLSVVGDVTAKKDPAPADDDVPVQGDLPGAHVVAGEA